MKIYKAAYVITDDEWDEDEDDWTPDTEGPADPPGWAEYCTERWGEYKDFFAPTDRKLYRSRSAAQGRVNLINRWFGDGAAVLLETDTEWTPVAEAVARRAGQKRQARIDKLRAEADALEALQ